MNYEPEKEEEKTKAINKWFDQSEDHYLGYLRAVYPNREDAEFKRDTYVLAIEHAMKMREKTPSADGNLEKILKIVGDFDRLLKKWDTLDDLAEEAKQLWMNVYGFSL